MLALIIAAAALVLGWWVIPDVLWHGLRLGVVSRAGLKDAAVALTFDDGPGEFTEDILDVLAAHQAKATFFVMADRALRHPELVQRMVAEGHTVACHGMRHRPAALLGPWASYRQVAVAKAQIETIAQRPVHFFRPPWGQHNLLLPLLAWRSRLTTVLWSIAPGDWVHTVTPEELAARVLLTVRAGDIVLLHDAGHPDRGRTLLALGPILDGLKARRLRAVGLETLLAPEPPPRMRLTWQVRLWEHWERYYGRRVGLDTVGDDQGNICRLAKAPFPHPSLTLNDGTRVETGDPAAEIHFANLELAQTVSGAQEGVRALRRIQAAFPEISATLLSHPRYQDVKVLYGTTLFHPVAARMGFEIHPVSAHVARTMGIYMSLLQKVYKSGRGGAVHKASPRLAVLSREAFLRRFPAHEEGIEAQETMLSTETDAP